MATKKSQPTKPAVPPGTRAITPPAPRNPVMASATPGASPTSPIKRPDGLWERIARKAYALWEQRGRREGRDVEDWLDAEAQVMEEMHEARE